MQNQSLRLFLYSSLAIAALTLVWGFGSIPNQGKLAEEQLRVGLEQELLVVGGAAKAATAAMKYRLLDILKAEGNDHPTRAFQEAPFAASALLSWDDSQWKTLWFSSKYKEQFGPEKLKEWIAEWPMAKIDGDEAFFAKVGEVEGQPHFAIVMRVARPNNVPMLGLGVFPAAQFGMTFSAEQTREVRVFDDKGFAIALAHPAYLGASLKREPLVSEMLDGDSVTVRQEWKSERGIPMIGQATRLAGTNLFAAIETKTPVTKSNVVQAWVYLVLCALAALGMNWFLFARLIGPLLTQLNASEAAVEKYRRQLTERPVAAAPAPVAIAVPDQFIPSAELPNVGFVESAEAVEPAPVVPRTPLAKVVAAALRALEPRIRENAVSVDRIGLESVEVESDVLQLQTAIEEVLKNAIEAMKGGQLTIAAHVTGGRVHLTVEDTGSGIADENLKNVFDPFFSTKDSEGVARGLGLNVVRRVIEELRGSIVIENRRDVSGVRVLIEWPTTRPTVASVDSPRPGFELDLLNEEVEDAMNEEFVKVQIAKKRDWPEVPVRKPRVRTLE